jgi:hypothetical protein
MWRLSNTLLNDQWVIKELKVEIRKFLECKTTEDGKISYTHAESILWKWLYYQKKLMFSIQSPQKFNDIHCRDWKSNIKLHLEAQQTVDSQGNNEVKSSADGIIILDFKQYYKSLAIKTSIKQTWKQVEQSRRPKYKFTQLCPLDFWQRHPKHTMEKTTLFNKCFWEIG